MLSGDKIDRRPRSLRVAKSSPVSACARRLDDFGKELPGAVFAGLKQPKVNTRNDVLILTNVRAQNYSDAPR
jgi:hypothetical protein